MPVHHTHVTRFSDSSWYDEICTNCGAHDIAGGGYGDLVNPCTAAEAHKGEVPEVQVVIDAISHPTDTHTGE